MNFLSMHFEVYIFIRCSKFILYWFTDFDYDLSFVINLDIIFLYFLFGLDFDKLLILVDWLFLIH
jgi:hypothetical protein